MDLNSRTVTGLLVERYRCPDDLARFEVSEDLSKESGYFRYGPNIICYGQCSTGKPGKYVTEAMPDVSGDISLNGSAIRLPFDAVQVVENLQFERYHAPATNLPTVSSAGVSRGVYYMLRPLLGVSARKYLQRFFFRHWREIPFPKWPVDRTVDDIIEQVLILSMKALRLERIPFIWFWPDGMPTCAMLTHDVETSAGMAFCSKVMDLDDSFGAKSAFQVVPEKRYTVTAPFLESIRKRGFEINVHDLNHDGCLWSHRDEFLRRAQKLNRYGREFGAQGFRSAVMYRNTDWYDALDFSYDMSIPNVAHLDPQRGGCCTTLPFFIGNILELPLTTTQDYALFNILGDYSMNVWKQQMSLIREKNGLMSFIIHPDYIIEAPARRLYSELLQHLADLRTQGKTWIALPGEIAAWWRLRSKLNLVNEGGSWRIVGEGSGRANLAYAVLENGRIVYEVKRRASRQSASDADYVCNGVANGVPLQDVTLTLKSTNGICVVTNQQPEVDVLCGGQVTQGGQTIASWKPDGDGFTVSGQGNSLSCQPKARATPGAGGGAADGG